MSGWSLLWARGPAPLNAGQVYEFRFIFSGQSAPLLRIPHHQRGHWDDFGVADLPEQEAYVFSLLRRLNVSPLQPCYPGEFRFSSSQELENVMRGLQEELSVVRKGGPGPD